MLAFEFYRFCISQVGTLAAEEEDDRNRIMSSLFLSFYVRTLFLL